MLVYGQAEQGTAPGTTAQELLLPVKAIALNLYLCQRSRRVMFLTSAREIVIVRPRL